MSIYGDWLGGAWGMLGGMNLLVCWIEGAYEVDSSWLRGSDKAGRLEAVSQVWGLALWVLGDGYMVRHHQFCCDPGKH